jgi:transposase
VLSVGVQEEEKARMTVAVRTDFAAAEVRELAKAAATPNQARRLLAIALVLEGSNREDAARSTGMDRQTLRDWVHRFNAAGAEGLVARKAPGRQRRLSPEQQRELAHCLESGLKITQDGVVRWRLPLLPYSPELKPVENLWQFLRHNFLNTRVFASYHAIVAACCDAWTRLRAIPGQIRSITTRDWAKADKI